MQVDTIQQSPGFVRLVVEAGGERTELDLAADARLFPAQPGRIAPTLALDELAADKVLAVFGRAEARDFADLAAVERRYGLRRLCELAAEKDAGFDVQVFAEMLDRFDRLRRDEFGIDDRDYDRLATSVRRWHQQALELSWELHHEHDRGRDLGLGL